MGESARTRAALRRYESRLVETGLAAWLGPDRVAAQVADVGEALAAPPPTEVRRVVRSGGQSRVSVTSGSTQGVAVEPVRGPDGRIDVEASVLNGRLLRQALATPVHGTLAARALQQLVLRSVRRRTDMHMDELVRSAYRKRG